MVPNHRGEAVLTQRFLRQVSYHHFQVPISQEVVVVIPKAVLCHEVKKETMMLLCKSLLLRGE